MSLSLLQSESPPLGTQRFALLANVVGILLASDSSFGVDELRLNPKRNGRESFGGRGEASRNPLRT